MPAQAHDCPGFFHNHANQSSWGLWGRLMGERDKGFARFVGLNTCKGEFEPGHQDFGASLVAAGRVILELPQQKISALESEYAARQAMPPSLPADHNANIHAQRTQICVQPKFPGILCGWNGGRSNPL
jgi:hypothetical protein